MDTNTNKYYNTFDMMEEAIKTKEVCDQIAEMLELHNTDEHEDVIVRMRGISINMTSDKDDFISGLILEELSDFYNDRLNSYLRTISDMLEDELWGTCDCDCDDCSEFEDYDSFSFLDENADFDKIIPEPTDFIRHYESL